MKNEIIIHKIGKTDIDTIINLANAVWPATYKDILSQNQIDYMMQLFYSRPSLEEQMAAHTFLIAYLDNEPVGFASYSPSAADGVYKLHKLYVNTAIQGKGLGRALIHFIIRELQTIHADSIELNVNRHNLARSFYEKLGFEVIREEDINIGHNYWMNDYVMRLKI